MIWHLRGIHDGREPLALRLISIAFFALGLYILGQTAYAFAVGVHPNASLPGIGWLVLTVAAMLTLAWGKHATGVALDNTVLKDRGPCDASRWGTRGGGVARSRTKRLVPLVVGRSAGRIGYLLLCIFRGHYGVD